MPSENEINSFRDWQSRPREEKPMPKVEDVFSPNEIDIIKETVNVDEQSRQIDKKPTTGFKSSEVPFTPQEQKRVKEEVKKEFKKIQTGEIEKPKPTKKLRQ